MGAILEGSLQVSWARSVSWTRRGAGFIEITLAATTPNREAHVANVQFVRKGDHEFTAMFTYRAQHRFSTCAGTMVAMPRVKWRPGEPLGFNTPTAGIA